MASRMTLERIKDELVAERRTRGSAYPVEVRARVQSLYIDGEMPTAIHKQLIRDGKGDPDWNVPLPTIKTWVKNVRRASDADWDFLDTDPADCRSLAPALVHGMERAAETGRPKDAWPTVSEAQWMLRVVELTKGQNWTARRVWELGRYAAALAGDPAEQHALARSLMAVAVGTLTPEKMTTYRQAGYMHGGTAVPQLDIRDTPYVGGAATKGPQR